MKKNKSFAEKAYQSTKLDFGYTQSKIQNMLNEVGITNVRITQIGDEYTVEFIVRLRHSEAPRKVRINVPYITESGDSLKKKANKKNALFRVLFYHLKNRFVAVSNGLREFDEEFAQDIVVTVNGKEQRLGDILVPEIKRQLRTNDKVVLKITN